MANDNGWYYGCTNGSSAYITTTGSTTSTLPVVWTVPANYTYSYGSGGAGGAGHIPDYTPPSLAEDELAWLRRRVTEVTDLFPAAA